MKRIILFFLCCLCFACTEKYSPAIEAVLKQAGNNRSELEKVLKHYGKNPADSLKLRSAEFLIVNMPGKHSKYYDAPLEDVATVLLRWTSSSNKRLVLNTYGIGELIVREDVKYITGDYLINNIEFSFKVWLEQPWCKHIPFDVFCEEILPYRIHTEPLENWRAKALASFADINRSFRMQPDISAVEACRQVNRLLPVFRIDKDFIPMSYSMLMATTRNDCYGISALSIFVMRALGIPVVEDYIPVYHHASTSHSWNAVRDSSGNYITFEGAEIDPGDFHHVNIDVKSKVFRTTFAIQRHIAPEDISTTPPIFLDSCSKDISSEYQGFVDAKVPVIFPSPAGAPKDVYLAVLHADAQWKIVDRGKSDGTTVLFSIMNNIIYMPVYYADNTLTPAGNPFWIGASNNMQFFEASATRQDKILLSDVKPLANIPANIWTNRMLHGMFEAANSSDFSDATPLHTINELPDELNYNKIKVKNTNKFRYIRYVAPELSFCNVAEIDIYGTDGEKLSGTPIGVRGRNSEMDIDKVFDGNTATFYDVVPNSGNGSWVGLDFGEPKQVGEIQYFPRNDHFEIFYWNKNEWQPAGKLNADNFEINVPYGTLFRMHVIGQEERTFFFLRNEFDILVNNYF